MTYVAVSQLATPDPRDAAAEPKDLLANTLVLGIASSAWFGWAQQGDRLPGALAAGSVAGLTAAFAGILLRRRAPGRGSHQTNPGANRTWTVAVLVEVLLIVGGAVVLGRTGHPQYLAAWTLAVVGVHFAPLARLYRIGSLYATGAAAVGVAASAVLAGARGWAHPATLAGGLGGLVLLVDALVTMVQAQRASRAAGERR